MKLSATSALVLLWARQSCYKSNKARDYLNLLNLEEGKLLYDSCMEICPYYDEVIKNRKYGIFKLIEGYFNDHADNAQLVIAGAGFDALGLEVIEHFPQVKIFELDREKMHVKSKLVSQLNCNLENKINHIEADLLEPDLVKDKLIDHGWNPEQPTLLVFEGISYYLPVEGIKKLCENIKPNRLIFEYLKEDELVSPEKLSIPSDIFGLIAKECELPKIGKFSYDLLEKVFTGLFIDVQLSMRTLEQQRTGINKFFPTESSGWIEICQLG